MTSEQRLILMFEQSGMTKRNWALKIGVHESSLINICKGRKTTTPLIMKKIADACPEYNPDWVIRGFGPMLKDGTPAPSVANSVAQNDEVQDARSVSFTAHLMKQNEMLMAEKAKMLDIIMNLTAQLGKLNLQSEAGYATVVKFLPELASVA